MPLCRLHDESMCAVPCARGILSNEGSSPALFRQTSPSVPEASKLSAPILAVRRLCCTCPCNHLTWRALRVLSPDQAWREDSIGSSHSLCLISS